MLLVKLGYILSGLGRARCFFKRTNQLLKRSQACTGPALEPIDFLDLSGSVSYPIPTLFQVNQIGLHGHPIGSC